MQKTRQPIRITVYTRPLCHLCDEAEKVIRGFQGRYDVRIETIDVDESTDLCKQFGHEVPVVFLNGKKRFKYRVSPARLALWLKSLSAKPAGP